jgi:hypothetical protein
MFIVMKITDDPLRNSRGIVLMSALTILSVLLAVGIGIRVMLKNDYQVVANLRGGTEAFYYSAAGIEWSKNEVASTAAFPPVPANQTKSFAAGAFAVSFLHPVLVGPLTARVAARSVGTIGPSSHVLEALLTKTYDLADGALALRGAAARMNISGSGLFISGTDHDPANGNPLTAAKSRSAISVSDSTMNDLVMGALGNPPPLGILDSANDVQAVALSDYLSGTAITQLANDLCAAPGASVHSVPSGATLAFENQVWGSQATPQLHCIEGQLTGGDGASFTGNNSGFGILVVKNADLILNGGFHWDGLVLVSGQEVGLRVFGSSSKEVMGATLINETGAPGSATAIFDIQGNLRLLFSRQALRRASVLIPSVALSQAYTALPSYVLQDYWRTVTP